MVIPHVGTHNWIKSLNLTITESNWDAWYSNGQVAGFKTTYAHDNYSLVFATVKVKLVIPTQKHKICYVHIYLVCVLCVINYVCREEVTQFLSTSPNNALTWLRGGLRMNLYKSVDQLCLKSFDHDRSYQSGKGGYTQVRGYTCAIMTVSDKDEKTKMGSGKSNIDCSSTTFTQGYLLSSNSLPFCPSLSSCLFLNI